MNGLQAIELMKQGKLVTNGYYIFRYNNETFEAVEASTCNLRLNKNWGTEVIFDLNDCHYEEFIPYQTTGWERVKIKDFYYRITENCIAPTVEFGDMDDNVLMDKANYFSIKEKAEEIDFEQTLFRKLKRFSDENGGSEIDYSRGSCQHKWFIEYDKDEQLFSVSCYYDVRVFGTVYFSSKEVAYKAIEIFKDDLIKYFER